MTTAERLARDLGLPPPDPFDQDWEWTHPIGTIEYVRRYVAAYSRDDYGPPERVMLVSIIIDVANEMRWAQKPEAEEALAHGIRLIREAPDLHQASVEYWASFDVELEDAWAVAPEFRALWTELFPGLTPAAARSC